MINTNNEFEMDKGYYDIAVERIEQAKALLCLDVPCSVNKANKGGIQ